MANAKRSNLEIAQLALLERISQQPVMMFVSHDGSKQIPFWSGFHLNEDDKVVPEDSMYGIENILTVDEYATFATLGKHTTEISEPDKVKSKHWYSRVLIKTYIPKARWFEENVGVLYRYELNEDAALPLREINESDEGS